MFWNKHLMKTKGLTKIESLLDNQLIIKSLNNQIDAVIMADMYVTYGRSEMALQVLQEAIELYPEDQNYKNKYIEIKNKPIKSNMT